MLRSGGAIWLEGCVPSFTRGGRHKARRDINLEIINTGGVTIETWQNTEFSEPERTWAGEALFKIKCVRSCTLRTCHRLTEWFTACSAAA